MGDQKVVQVHAKAKPLPTVGQAFRLQGKIEMIDYKERQKQIETLKYETAPTHTSRRQI